MRLMTWFSLEQKAESPPERGKARDGKLAALTKAQKAGQLGTSFSPDFLLTAIMALATAWTAANPFRPLPDPDTPKRSAALRRSIAEAIRRLTKVKIDVG